MGFYGESLAEWLRRDTGAGGLRNVGQFAQISELGIARMGSVIKEHELDTSLETIRRGMGRPGPRSVNVNSRSGGGGQEGVLGKKNDSYTAGSRLRRPYSEGKP